MCKVYLNEPWFQSIEMIVTRRVTRVNYVGRDIFVRKNARLYWKLTHELVIYVYIWFN